MLGKNPKAELVAAADYLEPADLAAVNEIAWRLVAWKEARNAARSKFGERFEQHKKSLYHLNRVRHRLRQARHNGGTMSDVDWLSDDRLAEMISVIPQAECC